MSNPPCPDCGNDSAKYGHRYRRGGPVQCYICKVCGRSFTDNTLAKGKPARKKDEKSQKETPEPAITSSGTPPVANGAAVVPAVATQTPPESTSEQDARTAYLEGIVQKEKAEQKPED